MTGQYDDAYARSLADPEGFWGEAAAGIDWTRRWDRVLDDANPPYYRWFAGGELNTCYNALDRHVENGRGEQTALIYDSPVTGQIRYFSYAELLDVVARTAGMIAAAGITKGDRVLIYMPMVPEAAIAMLACARIGAVHSVVFGGFASNELAKRIDDAKPKLVLTASCGIEVDKVISYKPLLDGALKAANWKDVRVILLQRPEVSAELDPAREADWTEALGAAPAVDCVPVAATDPLYILYTSGTTGVPKGIVRDTGGHAVSLNWSMKNVYGIEPGEVFWAASDVGWVVGHAYIVYAPLFHGCTTILYEGKPVGTPDPGAFWRVIAEHKVTALFTAPTAFRAIKRDDPNAEYLKKYDLSHFRTLFLAGERTDPDTLAWAESILGVPVIDHWWQTETGWAVAANCIGLGRLPVKPGSPTKPVPGFDVWVLDDDAQPVEAGEIGTFAIKLPMPPGCLATLWHNDAGYVTSYLNQFEGYYSTADAGFVDEDGYLYIMSRTDDIINVAGHRLSTGGMEEVLSGHPDVAECAVLGVADALKGQVPLGLVVLKAGVERSVGEIVAELVRMVRERIGPVAAFKLATVVKRLPKTRSGKILRGTIRKMADGDDFAVPPTIEDPEILDEIREALAPLGYPKS